MRTKTKRFDFQTACRAMLIELGAVEDPKGYGLLLNTVAGGLQCKSYEDWLAAKFNDLEQATAKVHSGNLNPFSGKWNWHFTSGSEADLNHLRLQLDRIILQPTP